MNILNYLFAEEVQIASSDTNETEPKSDFIYDENATETSFDQDKAKQLSAVTNSVFHTVATTDDQSKLSNTMVGSRDALATENDFIRSAVKYGEEIIGVDASLFSAATMH